MAGLPADRDEKSVFKEFSYRITSGVNFGDLVPKASSCSELISDREREDCLSKKNNYEMGDAFVGIMNRRISAHPSNFYIFVYLLKSLGQGERDIATEMEAEVGAKAEDTLPRDTLEKINRAAGIRTSAGRSGPPPPSSMMVSPAKCASSIPRLRADAKPTLPDLQYMSYTSEDGTTVHFRLMDRIKPRVTDLAVALGFPQHVRDYMETKRDQVYYILSEWLEGRNRENDQRPLTWGTLITALQRAGLPNEAEILQQHFVDVPQVAMINAPPDSVSRDKQPRIETDYSASQHLLKDNTYPIADSSNKGGDFLLQSVIDAKQSKKGLAVIVTNGNYENSKYSSLSFTENDGKAMKETFNDFDFNCYSVKDLTVPEIQDLVDQMSNCKYPGSYKYVVFVYSGHGNISSDGRSSGLVGIDGEIIETTSRVIDPIKCIEPQSIFKIVFIDACRGIKHGIPKGEPTNCLVAYATQFRYVAYCNDSGKGSRWMMPLAEKLKQREKSVQQVLKEVAEELLTKGCSQYPEMDDSDCKEPIFLAPQTKGTPPAHEEFPKLDGKPKIVDLAYLAKRDGNGLIRIIDRILEKDISTIERFSRTLLESRDRPVQLKPGIDEEKQRFCLEVLIKWLSTSTPKTRPTWNNLIECLEDAELMDVAKDIKDNLG